MMRRDVVTVNKEDTAYDAALLMSYNKVGSVVVTEDEKIVGIVTERDLVRKVCTKSLPSNQVSIKDIMSKPVITGEPDLELEIAVQRMLNNSIRRLPIIENHKLVGIITITDLAKYLRTRKIIDKILE